MCSTAEQLSGHGSPCNRKLRFTWADARLDRNGDDGEAVDAADDDNLSDDVVDDRCGGGKDNDNANGKDAGDGNAHRQRHGNGIADDD